MSRHPSNPVRVVICGSRGRMARALIAQFSVPENQPSDALPTWKSPQHKSLILHGLIARAPLSVDHHQPQHPTLKRIPTLIPNSSDRASFLDNTDVIIDFTPAVDVHVNLAVMSRCAYVCGSTGLSRSVRADLDRAATSIPVLYSANFSLGIAVLRRLVDQATQLLPDWDIALHELHHIHKKDAPSGTALSLAKTIDEARVSHSTDHQQNPTAPTTITSTRGGTCAGEHCASFLGPNERLELWHRSENSNIFAIGALSASSWIQGQPPGHYSFENTLT